MNTTRTARRSPLAPESKETGTVHRVARLLSAIANSSGSVRVSSLATAVGLAPSTTHRLLHLLRREGLVDWSADGHNYSIGAELYRLSARVIGQRKIADVAQPYIDRLAHRFGEAALFGVAIPSIPAMIFVARADGQHPLQYRIQMNHHLSLLWGASGKSILAFADEALRDRVLAHERGQGSPAPPLKELEAALQLVRRRGFAVSEGEKLPGAQGIAAPVFGPDGIVGCLCITAPKGRIPRDSVLTIGRAVALEAAELSRALGAPLSSGA
jgi:DNA-binding IclR family transcriptional regulator